MASLQQQFTNAPDIGFPGEPFNDASRDGNYIFSYPSKTDLYVARAVKKGAAVSSDYGNNAGNIIADASGVTEASELVGVVMLNKTAKVDDTGAAVLDKNRMVSVMRFGLGGLVIVKANGTIAAGDKVYVAVNSTNDASIELGEFTNEAGAGGKTGMLELPHEFYLGNSGSSQVAVIDTRQIITENGGGE